MHNYKSVCVYVSVWVYVWVQIFMYMHIYVCMCVSVFVCLAERIYINIDKLKPHSNGTSSYEFNTLSKFCLCKLSLKIVVTTE